MKIETKDIKLVQKGVEWYLGIKVPNHLLDKIKNLAELQCVKTIEVKCKRKSRSLNANSYAWTLINKIAIKMGSTDNEIYEHMLSDYGTKEYVVAMPEARPNLLKAYKIVEVVSKAKVNGKNGTQFRLIRGSSTYDTLEMSILIKGIVEEAKALDIETLTPNEIESMIEISEVL